MLTENAATIKSGCFPKYMFLFLLWRANIQSFTHMVLRQQYGIERLM